jgi:hypothetical protein
MIVNVRAPYISLIIGFIRLFGLRLHTLVILRGCRNRENRASGDPFLKWPALCARHSKSSQAAHTICSEFLSDLLPDCKAYFPPVEFKARHVRTHSSISLGKSYVDGDLTVKTPPTCIPTGMQLFSCTIYWKYQLGIGE